MKAWYEQLFENYANQYENEIFTKGTLGECNFLETEINYNKAFKILDIGCGTGRHSIELAKRGYQVTGFDLSKVQIDKAKENAEKQGVSVDFFVADAREKQFENQFDLAIMLCEGGFSLMETDEMNFEILKNAALSLKKGGKLIFTTLNGLFPLFHSVKDFFEKQKIEGNAQYNENTFDLMTFRDHNKTAFTDDSGWKWKTLCDLATIT